MGVLVEAEAVCAAGTTHQQQSICACLYAEAARETKDEGRTTGPANELKHLAQVGDQLQGAMQAGTSPGL